MEFNFDMLSSIIFPLESFLISLLYLNEYEKITDTLPKPKDFVKPEVFTEYEVWNKRPIKMLFWKSRVWIVYFVILVLMSLLFLSDGSGDFGSIFSMIISMSFINVAHFFISTRKK